VAGRFGLLGLEHLATGYDHVAFVLALALGAKRLRDVLIVATGFTVAHSLTLALAATGVFRAPSSIVEPLIALSIVLVAVENRLGGAVSVERRTATAFAFGLVHGLGFAGALASIGLPLGARVLSLGAFNVGVELGQAAIVVAAWPVLTWLRRRGQGERAADVGSAILAACGLWWLVQRVT
jgi:hydrogenase/urease accessory protein HupE